jgi:HlyD family secretion protein
MSAKFNQAANAYKPDAAAIEEAGVPISAHAALWVVTALLVTAVIWSMIGKVDRIVVAPGKIATQTPMLVMQPFTTSRVISIDVKPGDHVVKGQVLARFDPAFAQADVSSIQQKVDTLTAQTQRLEAQLNGRPFTADADSSVDRMTQAQIFAQELSDYNAQLSQRTARLGQIESQIQVDDTTIPGQQQQLAMAQRVAGMYDRLQRQQAAATLDILRSQSSLIDAQNRLRATTGDREKLNQQHAETIQERQAYIDKWRTDHNQQLVEARQQLAEAVETLNKANRMHDFTQITAPVDGTVQEVADRSNGSVMREAETLVTLVPDKADLYVEANVPSRDISYLTVGDSVRVKLESYPFQRFGTVSGVLTVISPDSQPLKEGEDQSKLVYKVQVKLNETVQSLAQRNIHLKPGLVSSAEIKTGGQTIAAYVLHPVLKIADESLREP